jgi:putative cardiolipin synthase
MTFPHWLRDCGRYAATAGLAIAASSCAGLPPGADFPRTVSQALAQPQDTQLGGQVAAASREHGGTSGFRIITLGIDGLLVRAQMIDTAERTLDLQYFIFRGDVTGHLLVDALHRAATRGVRVRVLVDDADTLAGDEQVLALDGLPNVEIRVFNPFAYRGHARFVRTVEFLFNVRRLDYRMHNKLIVVDNAVALVGGRNIGDQYFQIDPDSQFADDDVFTVGPVAAGLSATFDEYWNSGLAIPAAALGRHRSSPASAAPSAEPSADQFSVRIASGEPYASMIAGRVPLVWAPAWVVCDSPHKKQVEDGARAGQLLSDAVFAALRATRTELLMVTPYFIPDSEESQALQDLRRRQVRIRLLTNSLEGSAGVFAHSGYRKFRVPLLQEGVELYEARALLGSSKGSGQTASMTRHGNYALHAKLYVFDRQKLFVGSMNFDRRSKHLNTEIGLIIDSPELAEQTATRFNAMVQPQNVYVLSLRPESAQGGSPQISWHSEEAGKGVDFSREPARSDWQRFKVQLMSRLPLAREQ